MITPALVSIIMPSFNQAEFITQSIDCVMTQGYGNIELVISDGGSTDGTVSLLEKMAAKYDGISWISEKDSGPAEALNRSLARTRGTIIGWLNSDDLYTPGAIQQAVDKLSSDANLVMVYGHGEHIDLSGNVLNRYPTLKPDVGIERFASGCYICQPTAFFKRTVYTLLGPLRQDLKTTFDYEYWLRVFRTFPDRIGFIDQVLAQSRLHDGCITLRMRHTIAVEAFKLTHAYLGKGEIHWLTTYIEELLAQSPKQRGLEKIEPHIVEILDSLHDYLGTAEIDLIKQTVKGL